MTKTIVDGRIVDEDGVISEPEGEELSEKAALGMLTQYAQIRRDIAQLERAQKRAREALRSYIERHGELYDGERRIRGFIQTRRSAPKLDNENLPEDLLAWLKAHDCLELRQSVFSALDKEQAAAEVVRVKDFLTPTGGTTALIVKEEK